jgi:hypothetical protein
MIDREDIEAIAQRVVELQAIRLGGAMPLDPVYTLKTAMEYVGTKSESGFYRWKLLRGLQACGPGRYRKSALDRALDVSANVIAGRRGKLKRKSRMPQENLAA